MDQVNVFYKNLLQGICQKILDSAVPHPEDKNIIQQIAAGVACPSASISRSVPHFDLPKWGFTYQVTHLKRVPPLTSIVLRDAFNIMLGYEVCFFKQVDDLSNSSFHKVILEK